MYFVRTTRIGQTDRPRGRTRLRERAAAVGVHARAFDEQRHKGSSDRNVEAIGDADVGVHGGHAGVDVQRQSIDIERRGLVRELVRCRHKRAVAQVAAVERREMQLLHREPERRAVATAGQRPLREERPEALRRTFDRAKLRVQAVHERSGRRGHRQGREIFRKRARDGRAGRLSGFAISLHAARRHRLVRHQEREHVADRLR